MEYPERNYCNTYTGFRQTPSVLINGRVSGGEHQESIGNPIRSSLKNPRNTNSDPASPSSSSTSQIFNGDLMKELECQICTDIMTPPVHLCTNGHSLCGKCRPRMSRCGFCAGSFVARNHCVENILNGCSARCEYHSRGCSEIIKLSEFGSHVNLCTFNPNPSLPPPPEIDLWSDFNEVTPATARNISVELQRLNHQNLVTLSMLQGLGPFPSLGQHTRRYQEGLDNLTLRLGNQTENMNRQEAWRNQTENMNRETLRLNREFDGLIDRVISDHQTYRQQLNALRASLNSSTSPSSSMTQTSPIVHAPVEVLIEDDGSPFTASDVTSASIASTSSLRPQPTTPATQPQWQFVPFDRTYIQTGSRGGNGHFGIPSAQSSAARNRRNEAIQNTLLPPSLSPTRSIPPRIAATAVPNEARQQSISRFPVNQIQPAITTRGPMNIRVTATEAGIVAVSGVNANSTQARTVTGANENPTQARTVSGYRPHQSNRCDTPYPLPRSHRNNIVQPGRHVSRRLSSAYHPPQSLTNSRQSASSVNQNSSNPRSRHVCGSSNQYIQRPSNGTVTPQRAPLSTNPWPQEQSSVQTSFNMDSLGWHTVQRLQRPSPAPHSFSAPLQPQPNQVGNVNVSQSPSSGRISSR